MISFHFTEQHVATKLKSVDMFLINIWHCNTWSEDSNYKNSSCHLYATLAEGVIRQYIGHG